MIFIFVLLSFVSISFAQSLQECADKAWDVSLKRFYSSETHQFYDYLTSYENGKELAHLPTPEEVKQLKPKITGYDTGMEDCMISAGVLLDMLADKYAVTKDESLRKYADEIVVGIKLSATVHGEPGFLARGVCPADGKSVYIGSSRDQYTRAVHGLWAYYRSPLCNDAAKKEIAGIVKLIADRLIRNVVPENNYDSLRLDGTQDTSPDISKFWNVKPHEAARLPMIYGAAWDITGEQKYLEQYQKYVEPAIQQSLNINYPVSGWALLQTQGSIEVLKALTKDAERIAELVKIMALVSAQCAPAAKRAFETGKTLDLTELAEDWRKPNGGITWGNAYRKVWYCIRESGEMALAQLLDEAQPFPPEQKEYLIGAIRRIDYDRCSSNGIFYLQGAYWKAKRRGVL
ncbi:MAG: hypothetical protein FWE67_12695 [Planctomycetaceae bacterium]|nr:hypothetical protein [Planctomycetaceae bacterium]